MHHCYGLGPVDLAGARQNPLTEPLYMMVVQILVAIGQLEKQGAGNRTGTGTGAGAGPERYRITSLIRAIKWV